MKDLCLWTDKIRQIKTIGGLLVLVLLGPVSASGYERIVVLYAPASSVIKALGAGKRVVGRTRTDRTFPRATNVGSHLRPNIELIKALRADLVVAGSIRAFPEEMARRLDAKIYRYDPRNLEELFQAILDLGDLLGKKQRAKALVLHLKERLKSIRPLPYRPGIIYEVSQNPLKVAGQRSMVTAIIEAAGGRNLVRIDRKHVILSPEEVIRLSPDLYIYQEGPMNRRPLDPKDRPYFSALKAKTVKVSEEEFARPGLNVIDAIIKLNRILARFSKGDKR